MLNKETMYNYYFPSIVLLASLALSRAGEPSLSTHVTGPCDQSEFEAFLSTYNKSGVYGESSSDEYKKRCGIFTLNKALVDEYNSNTSKKVTFGINEHSDLSREERTFRNGGKPDLDITPSKPTEAARRRRLSQQLPERRNLQTLPTSIDYTTTDNSFGKIAVTDVKNQGQCGDCYTFAAAAIVEGQLALENGENEMVSLSEQQITDCVYDDDALLNQNGCKGGFINQALDYITAYGVATLEDYPQLEETVDNGTPGTCTAYSNYNSKSMATDYTPYATIQQKGYAESCDETSTMDYLNKYGPLGVAIIASSDYFQLYKSGIMTNEELKLDTTLSKSTCGSNIDHAVTLVGYGSEDGVDYWLIKNSWGTSWGENGYFKAERGVGGCSTACITFEPSWAYTSLVDPSNDDLSFEMDDDFYDYDTSSQWAPNPAPAPSTTSNDGTKMNAWQTALLVVGCVVVAVGGVIGYYTVQNQTKKRREKLKQNFLEAQQNAI